MNHLLALKNQGNYINISNGRCPGSLQKLTIKPRWAPIPLGDEQAPEPRWARHGVQAPLFPMATPEGWHHPPDHGRHQMLRHTSYGKEPCQRQTPKPDHEAASVRIFTCDLPNLKEGFTLSCLRCCLRSVKPHSIKRKKDAGDAFRHAAALGLHRQTRWHQPRVWVCGAGSFTQLPCLPLESLSGHRNAGPKTTLGPRSIKTS